MLHRNQIIKEARSWIGTPWRHQGCVKGQACDCVGLIKGVALNLGVRGAEVDPEIYRGYSRLPNPRIMFEGLDRYLWRISVQTAKPGDILLFAISGSPQHLAILAGKETIVHSFAQARKVVEQRVPRDWYRQIVRAYQYPGVA